jgi:hypothetical protein
MKKLGIIGFVLAAVSLTVALVNQFHFIKEANRLEMMLDRDIASSCQWAEAHHFAVLLGEIVLIASILALITCVISAFKTKSKLSIIGVVLSLIAIIFGLMQGTHMFS